MIWSKVFVPNPQEMKKAQEEAERAKAKEKCELTTRQGIQDEFER